MIRDITRAACVIACMTAAASLLVETRYQMASIDVAHRQSIAMQPVAFRPPQQIEQPGRIRQLGRASLNLADAALGIVR